mgnify:CR=1 FL=1
MMLELLSTTGFGAVLGWVGGMVNRYFDLKMKDKEILLLEKTQAHDLAKLDKEREFMQAEAAQKLQVLQTEGEQKVVQLGYESLNQSYDNDKATYGGGLVDQIRGVIRPCATALYGAASLFMVATILYYAFFVFNISFTAEQMFKMATASIQWVFFMAEMVVGWWFGSRPTPPRSIKVA